jgi:hypothetical protein
VVSIELKAASPPEGLLISVDKYDHPTQPIVQQSVVGQPNFESVYLTTPDIQKIASSIARLRIKTDQGEPLCTGFLVSDSLLMTNYHCISTSVEAANSQAEFGIDRKGAKGKTFRITNLEAVNSSLAYDYVIVRISGTPGRLYGHVNLPHQQDSDAHRAPAPGSLSFGDSSRKLLVIEHPGGGVKMVSEDNDCSVIEDKISGVDPQVLSDFGHGCDTLGGSSGSPVFNRDTNVLVGLHHLGESKDGDQGEKLKNQAVYIGYILGDISIRSPAIFAEITSSAASR